MTRVIVTGGSGFIGRHAVARLLADGLEVHTLGRRPCAWPGTEAARHHCADLLDDESVSPLVERIGASHLLHLAWYTDPATYKASNENLRWVGASLALLDAFARAGGQRAVLAGTCAEYDWRYGYLSEPVTPLGPSSRYGHAKRCLQELAQTYSAGSKLQLAWGRVFFLYGPGESPGRLVADVSRALLQGEHARTSSGEQLRDFLHVADVASGFCRLIAADFVGSLNISSGQPVTIRSLVARIAELAGAAARLDIGAVPRPPDDPPLLVGDNRRLLGIGWRPAYDLDSGIADTLDWWRNCLTQGPAEAHS